MPKEFIAWTGLEFKGLLFVQTLLRSILLSKAGKHPTDQNLRHCVHLPRAQSWILFLWPTFLKQYMHHSAWKAKQSHRGLRAGQYQMSKKSASEQLNHIHSTGIIKLK